jgi:xylulokinase
MTSSSAEPPETLEPAAVDHNEHGVDSDRVARSQREERVAERRLVAGVDCSTQGTKVLVVHADTGDVVATGRAGHTVVGSDGARETDPNEWYAALRTALASTGMADAIRAISIAGQQHGLVVLDEQQRPLRKAILWNDTRATAESAALVADLGGPASAAQLIGTVPGPAFTVSSWMWLRANEPEVARATAHIRLPHDWITGRMTGNAVTDRGDVSGTGWWSPITAEYLEQVLRLTSVDLDVAMLPIVLGPSEPAGTLTAESAAFLGLRAGTIVGPGTGDNPAAGLAVNAPRGYPVLSLGTSGTVFTTSSVPSTEGTGTVVGLADATGAFLPLACTLNCTLAIDWFAALLRRDRNDAAASSRGVVVLPFLDGERTPNLPLAAGSVVGLRNSSTPGEVLRAAYEGAAFSLLDAMDLVNANSSGIAPDAPLLLVGGGANGTVWRECLADLSGRPIAIVDIAEQTAYGAAIQAKAVLDGLDVRAVAGDWSRAPEIVVPARQADLATMERIRETRAALLDLNETERGQP